MPQYHNHKCCFTHIPKSAGSSIHKILSGSNRYSSHRRIVKDTKYKNYFKFTFVRNPWDRFLSTYFYFKKYGRDGARDVRMGKIVNEYKTFKHFTLNFNDIKAWPTQHWSEQVSWEPEAHDFIGRFESLQEDFNTVCDKIGIPRQELPHSNKSEHKHYTEYYDEETKQIIAEKYAKDIEYFGYNCLNK